MNTMSNKVDRVTATIRYSREENGAWKSLELGAEASIGLEDDWQISQALLYTQLAKQLKSLWAANGYKPSENGSHGPEKAVETPAREHWCRSTKWSLGGLRRTAGSGTPTGQKKAGAKSSPARKQPERRSTKA
jgi:hypothetical protein